VKTGEGTHQRSLIQPRANSPAEHLCNGGAREHSSIMNFGSAAPETMSFGR
jgi:hypothetical protein